MPVFIIHSDSAPSHSIRWAEVETIKLASYPQRLREEPIPRPDQAASVSPREIEQAVGSPSSECPSAERLV